MKTTQPTIRPQRPASDKATRKVINLLRAARRAVGEITTARRNEKLSATRSVHAEREISEIIKVLGLYLPSQTAA